MAGPRRPGREVALLSAPSLLRPSTFTEQTVGISPPALASEEKWCFLPSGCWMLARDLHGAGSVGGRNQGLRSYPAWLENSPATLLSHDFEVDASLARNAVLTRMPCPALPSVKQRPFPGDLPTVCPLRGRVSLPGICRPFLPVLAPHCDSQSVSCLQSPQKADSL